MKVVIADSSCLILFTNIGRLEILRQLFGEIWITNRIKNEYGLDLPSFVSVHDPIDTGRVQALSLLLDSGEASAVSLAVETPNCQIIIDEKKGRRIALALGLEVTGSVGVLIEASAKEFIKPDSALIDELDRRGFRLSPVLKEMLLRQG